MLSPVQKLALSIIPKVGPVTVRRLVAYTGSAEAVFKEKAGNLAKIPGIGSTIVRSLQNSSLMTKAEEEIKFIEKNNLGMSFYLDEDYPVRLKQCEDAPICLFYKGGFKTNAEKTVSIVGTRKPTEYGKEVCYNLVKDLADSDTDIQVISGLAYGIDITAHKASLEHQLNTVAVLGHGLHMLYPASHRAAAEKICNQGCLLTEFVSTKKPDPGNFVSRNRIIAGLADITIVVESAVRGGALITADMAFSYHREVAAFPGRANDKYSEGCNSLIKNNKAALIENATDLLKMMNWDCSKPKAVQASLFNELTENETSVVDILKQSDAVSIDDLTRQLQKPMHKIKADLLNLEFKGLIKSLPGNAFKLIS
ncbi:MAG: DNA-processing protein DprA [Bacteroidales bacterium]|nr:DNA-processing protein DprA [Bacteroidales bacterium]